MKVKLDDYEVRVLINGLIQQHRSYDAETNGQIDALALRLCDIAEAMKPGRKKKIPFEPVEIRVITERPYFHFKTNRKELTAQILEELKQAE